MVESCVPSAKARVESNTAPQTGIRAMPYTVGDSTLTARHGAPPNSQTSTSERLGRG